MNAVFKILEFDRVRERLAACASSPLGAGLAGALEPFFSLEALLEQQRHTTEMRDLVDYNQPPPMDGINDLRHYFPKIKIAGAHLTEEELVAVGQTLAAVRQQQAYFSSRHEKAPLLRRLADELQPMEPVEKELKRCIDENTLTVKDQASAELAQIRKHLLRAQSQARSRMESLVKSLGGQGLLQENLIAVRDGRLVLMVKEENKRQVRGLVHDQSASGSSLFIEPLESLEDNNRIRELQAQELREVERILRELTGRLREALPVLQANQEVLARLDFIYAKAIFSRQLDAHPVELIKKREISIAGGRHPLLLLRMNANQVAPLDVELGEAGHTLIISGPNAGGKTVALKTLGLLTIMARCGLHIPALPHSRIGGIEKVFASIGDQQSIDNDLSTFSSHLQDLKEIAAGADSNSLVLIDEIGAGTDPEEGSALAMALLEALTRHGCLSVVTTHQSALKAFAFRTEGVANGSMEFDVKTLKPTYRFRAGIPGSSYAFEIASRLGLAVALIARARELVGSQKDRLEGLILELQEKIQHYQNLYHQANIKESEYRGLAKLYQERSDALKRDEKQIKRKAVAEAEEMLHQANAAIEGAIRQIKEQGAERQAIRRAKESLAEQRQKVEAVREQVVERTPEPLSQEPVAVGDFVRWDKFNNTGQVLSEADGQNRVLLQVEGVKIRAPLEELRKIVRQPVRLQGVVQVNLEKPADYKNEIDLRGLRAEEALEKVEQFLDEAQMAGFSEVRIIHGKGTGKLRTSITAFLRQHPRVRASRLGNWNEGEAGVTVVELKS